MPGIYSDAQIAAWKTITDAVHAKGCKMSCQLWQLGRAGDPEVLASQGGKLLSSSAVPIDSSSPTPEAMTEEDIQDAISDYVTAAKNAIAAGFDMVEIHSANGYLPDQFLQDVCNKRTDSWGGSIENRCRFLLEVAKAVAAAVGSDKLGVRMSPYSEFQSMLMDDPDPTFKHVVEQLKAIPLAYIHFVEARIKGNVAGNLNDKRSVKWLVELWDNTSPVLVAGGFNAEQAKSAVDETYKGYDVMIVFGRLFISNPDLVFRIRTGVPLAEYDRPTFYTPHLSKGYTDYPFSPDFLAKAVA